MNGNLLYAQSGGVTAVINASAAGVITAARRVPQQIARVLAARHGIMGVLQERLVDTSALTDADLACLGRTPGGAFGSCRLDLDPVERNPAQYDRLFAVLAAHDVRALLYNGGNGSMETCRQIAAAAEERRFPLTVVGVPKTVDNDILLTDCCPGFGSAAKYLATSVREVGLDLAAMTTGGGRAFVLEVMGRNAGWLAAACALASDGEGAAPHVILLPEVPFDEEAFLAKVAEVVARHGACAVVVAEGLHDAAGEPIAMQERSAKGYVQLGGAGEAIAERIHRRLGCKVHFAVADYLQRAARHLASATDATQAGAVGEAAVAAALRGEGGMVAIERLGDVPYRWRTRIVPFDAVANLERRLPPEFIRPDGFGVTSAFRSWCRPLIEGEDWPAFRDGLPEYFHLRLPLLTLRLPIWAA